MNTRDRKMCGFVHDLDGLAETVQIERSTQYGVAGYAEICRDWNASGSNGSSDSKSSCITLWYIPKSGDSSHVKKHAGLDHRQWVCVFHRRR